MIFLFWYFSKSKSEDSSKIKLSEQEIQELIDEWEPEPLVGALSEEQKFELDKIPVINGPVGLKVKLADVKSIINFRERNALIWRVLISWVF